MTVTLSYSNLINIKNVWCSDYTLIMSNKFIHVTLVLFVLLCTGISSIAQIQLNSFGRYDSIVVLNKKDTLKNPWAGGLNTPQFYSMNLNNDLHPDLFVFDRDGSEPRVFINSTKQEKDIFKHAPQFEPYFPRMWDYAQLYDFDKDGREEIFTSDNGDYRVFKNNYVGNSPDSLSFELMKWRAPHDSNQYVDYITYKLFTSSTEYFYSNVYNEKTDISALVDVDYDGDMDIIAYAFGLNSVAWYENKSMDLFGTADSLEFRYSTSCWGGFMEDNIDFRLFLGSCKGGKSRSGSRHTGSSLLVQDLDCNGRADVIIGDISFNNLIAAYNSGTKKLAKMTSQDTTFPMKDVPVDLQMFPASYYLDVDNDWVKDLIVAPNSPVEFKNENQVYEYNNIGTSVCTDFKLSKKDFLVGSMIDLGSDAHPVYFDVDGDSLLDIVCGSFGKFETTPKLKHKSNVSYYKNIGSEKDPAFQLIDEDFISIPGGSDTGLCPAFGDLDGDNDLDLVLGNHSGRLYYYENKAATPQDSAVFVLTTATFDSVNFGLGCRPFLYDVNHDGLLDLLVGSDAHGIKFFPNSGTRSKAIFGHDNVVLNFGQIEHYDDHGRGYNTVYMAKLDSSGKEEGGGKDHLFVGRSDGYISLYTNIDPTGIKKFTDLGESFLYARNVSISGGDITGDGKIDLIYGQKTGGLSVLLKDGGNIIIQPPPDTADTTIGMAESISDQTLVYPNPTTGIIQIQSKNMNSELTSKIMVFNQLGVMLVEVVPKNGNQRIDLSEQPDGMYIISIQTDDGVEQVKVVKTNY